MDPTTKQNNSVQTFKEYLKKQAQDELKQLSPSLNALAQPNTTPSMTSPNDTYYRGSDAPALPQEYQKLLQQRSQPQTPYSAGGQLVGGANSILSNSGPITQAFGNRSSVEHFSGGVNYGTDIGVPQGTRVALPPGQWQVVQSYNKATTGGEGDSTNSGYGNSVLVQNMQTGEKLRFSHLSQNLVQPGMQLQGGTYIGATGMTGNATGPHLDLEYYNQNGQLNDVLNSAYAQYLGMGGKGTKGKGGGNPSATMTYNPKQTPPKQPGWLDQLYNGVKRNAGDFMKGFTGNPGEGVNSGSFAANIGDFLANATPGGEVTDLVGQGAHYLANLAHNLPQVGHGATMLPLMAGVVGSDAKALLKGTHGGFGGAPTTKILNQIEGSNILPKAHIQNLLNQGGIKQAEKDVLNQALSKYGDKVPVQDLANDVRSQLLPLERSMSSDRPYGDYTSSANRYESINLPYELRGATTNYQENIFDSPVKTSAGDVHFPGSVDGYFGHTRTEDVMKNKIGDNWDGVSAFANPDTRRVLEVQSDLFQKGRLDNEIASQQPVTKIGYDENGRLVNLGSNLQSSQAKDLERLKPYENIWQERLVREEMKKAAQDGIKKLQFPTGDTAMKIEGLGAQNNWKIESPTGQLSQLYPEGLKVGSYISDGSSEPHIITDVLGDGKFKAVPKYQIDLTLENDYPLYQEAIKTGVMDEQTGEINYDALKTSPLYKKILKQIPDAIEQYDISGKMDQSNPIHKFYESELAKYLKKFGAERVTDEQGNTWNQISVDPKLAKKPVEAFGIVPAVAGLGLATQQPKKDDKKAKWMMQQYSR